jgi:cobalt-zinc-cadmium efflux system membrane fusion protein
MGKALLFLFMLFFSSCFLCSCDAPSAEHHNHVENKEEFNKGIHGGRLLEKGSFALELQIFEQGVPPQYRVYAYSAGKLIPPQDYRVEVSLERLGGKIEHFEFTPVGDFHSGDKEVREPHSFKVNVEAQFKEGSYSWDFASYEGRTTISDPVAKLSGIGSVKATRGQIRKIAKLRGRIIPSEHRIAHVIPRFAGVVREGRKHIGDTVAKGEIIAVIESNQSLQPFEVRSQISGTVINGHVVVGEFIPENQWIYIVADLSEVWADFYVPLREKLNIKLDQEIRLSSIDGDQFTEGRVSYIAPYVDERTQSKLVRVTVPNADHRFLPGMFVMGDLLIREHEARVVVEKGAIQKFRDWQVVFVKHHDVYEVAPLILGKEDATLVEVIEGLLPGDEYVNKNAFLIKSDILKSGASHDH